MEQWQADRDFKAVPGQQVEPEIYQHFENVLDPMQIPADVVDYAADAFKIPVHFGFMCREPIEGNKRRCFIGNYFGKLYYAGLGTPEPILDGDYYQFDCLNAMVNDGFYPVSEFENEKEAVNLAIDYEATLIKYSYDNGVRTGSKVIYDPIL